MKKQFVLKVLILLIAGLSSTTCFSERFPNVVLLLADDLGINELGIYGQKEIETPNIDNLAKTGLMFTDFYAGSAVCSASRAVLVTGKNPAKVGIRGNAAFTEKNRWEGKALDRQSITIGEMFKKEGYITGFVGKWHLDDPDDVDTWAYRRGFDYALQEQWTRRFNPKKIFSKEGLWMNGDEILFPYDYKKYDCKDHFYTDFALDFLNQIGEDKPFFLFMSYRAPHSFEGPIRDKSLYLDRGWPESERVHAAKISLFDKQVGRLLEALKRLGKLDNTIILFTSDNGPHHSPPNHDHEFFDSNGIFRGAKRDLYEGGIRVPLIVAWEKITNPMSVTEHISGFQDIVPTLAEILGVEKSIETDGISFLPLLTDEKQPTHDYLNWEMQLSGWFQELPDGGFRQAARIGKWKAVRYGINSQVELFDLSNDPSELNNVADHYPTLVSTAKKIFTTARTDTTGFPFGGIIQNYKAQNRFKFE